MYVCRYLAGVLGDLLVRPPLPDVGHDDDVAVEEHPRDHEHVAAQLHPEPVLERGHVPLLAGLQEQDLIVITIIISASKEGPSEGS